MDLDGFKAFNDRHGHLAGDQLLIEAATTWRTLLRESDIIARTGGDEFTVMLTGCTPAEARDIADRMTAAAPDGVSCSAGLARWDGHEAGTRLIARADAALYSAKSDGPVVVAHDLPVAPIRRPAGAVDARRTGS
jgi:diguanylate cyclase (GGDEF)-like protein